MSICAFTSICEEDAEWIPQYLAEIARLQMPYAVHFDRCSGRTMDAMTKPSLCIGYTEQRLVEFNETHKQGVFDLVVRNNFDWALAWDMDEIWEKDAPLKIGQTKLCQTTADLIDVRWWNLWDNRDHVRIDGTFGSGHRAKFYNLRSGQWRFDHPITNGAKLTHRQANILDATGLLNCLHAGMMHATHRLAKKARWDRIYSTALKGDPNPYGFWSYACDESIRPITVRHGYL